MAELTETDIKTFGIESLKKHLKAITTSNNYDIVLSSYNNIELRFYTKKFLNSLDIKYNRDYTVLEHFYASNSHDFLKLLHSLIICNKVKRMRENNMPLNTFIHEVISWVDMCSSMLAYYSDEKYFLNRSTYNLPENTKREIYNYMKSVINNIKYGTGTDSEGNSYNSISFAEIK